MEYAQNNLNAARDIQGMFLCYSGTVLTMQNPLHFNNLFYFLMLLE